MKPITKKYYSKDLNIAYNDGLNDKQIEFENDMFLKGVEQGKEGRKEALKKELEFLEELKKFVNGMNGEDINDELRECNCDICQIARKIEKRISKSKKELGGK